MEIHKVLSGKEFKRIIQDERISAYSLHKKSGINQKTLHNYFNEGSDIKRSNYNKLVDAYNAVSVVKPQRE